MNSIVHNGSGGRIRELRILRGLSQRALADRVGISPSALSQFETGRAGLGPARLERIARELAEPVPPPATGDPAAVGGAGWRSFGPLPLDPVAAAAAAAFVEVGYHGASVRDVAARAGLSVPALYHHHRSKQDMLVAVLDVLMADLDGRMAAAAAEADVRAPGDPVVRFRLLVECLALEHAHRGEHASIAASEMRSLEPANRERIDRMRRDVQDAVTAAVRAGVAAGAFRTRHPVDAARAVVTLCTSLVQWYRRDGPLSPQEVAARSVELALDLVRRR